MKKKILFSFFVFVALTAFVAAGWSELRGKTMTAHSLQFNPESSVSAKKN